MSSVGTSRFMRPMDLRVTRRNHRRLQVQRLLMYATNALLVLLFAVGLYWAFQRTQQDARFAIEIVRTTGAVHTSPGAIAKITDRYRGANLFRLDIAALQSELLALPWVERVDVEKKIPDSLMIHITERRPVALLVANGAIRYVDRNGISFAPLSVTEGNPELPVITGAAPVDLPRTVSFLLAVRNDDPELYARISEVEPLAPESFRVFDRDLRTTIYLPAAGYAERWRQLYAIARAEAQELEYADLRFERRIVVKPRAGTTTVSSMGTDASAIPAVTN